MSRSIVQARVNVGMDGPVEKMPMTAITGTPDAATTPMDTTREAPTDKDLTYQAKLPGHLTTP